MRSLRGIGLGLSLVFCCLLLALVLELYYILCWKKRIVFQRQMQQQQQQQVVDDDEDEDKLSSGSSSAREFLFLFCCKKVSSLSSCAALNPRQICASVRTQQQQLSSNKDDLVLKSEDGFLCQTGPPKYLFTIMEETMEDLESDEDVNGCKSVESRKGSTSLNELLLLTVETQTPYLTPLSSPPFMTPSIHDYSTSSQSPHHRFNLFFESSSDAEISKIKASPPPKFRFLQAAEEKFNRRKMMDIRQSKAPTFSQESFITIVTGDHSNDRGQ